MKEFYEPGIFILKPVLPNTTKNRQHLSHRNPPKNITQGHGGLQIIENVTGNPRGVVFPALNKRTQRC